MLQKKNTVLGKIKSFLLDSGINNKFVVGDEHSVVRCKEYFGTSITYDLNFNFVKNS